MELSNPTDCYLDLTSAGQNSTMPTPTGCVLEIGVCNHFIFHLNFPQASDDDDDDDYSVKDAGLSFKQAQELQANQRNCK